MSNSGMKNKIAIVTGASSGIGNAISIELLKQGATVINADINPPEKKPEGNYYFFKANLINVEEVQQLFTYVIETVGLPNILVSNAGRGIHEKLSEGDPEKWAAVINTNLVASLRFIRAFVPGLVEKGEGDIVFISSVSAGNFYEYGGVYSASKTALEAIAETLRLELKEKARVTVVSPGVVDTSFFKNMESSQLSVDSIGIGSLHPRQVADAVMFALTRDRSQVINHITLRPIRQSF
jgi:NADP-dependent 3-hydroxy acid dehydrogenase YdfG